MEKNYKEHFSLDKLAEVGRLGKKTLQRRFRKATGETPRSITGTSSHLCDPLAENRKFSP